MSYTTVDSVRLYSGLTQKDASDAYKITDAYISLRITRAEAIINGYVGARYVLPITATSVLAFLEGISNELTVAYLYLDEYGVESKDTDKGWQSRMDNVYKQLDDISKGKFKLIDTTTGEEIASLSSTQPGFYPTAASSLPDATDTTKPQMTMNKRW